MTYIYLDKINYPKDLKKYKIKDLKKISDELRKNISKSLYFRWEIST